jgi:hypothetical protein
MAGWLEDHAQNHMISHPQAAWIWTLSSYLPECVRKCVRLCAEGG